ncbi:hypothetical protein [Amycolatopsis kentuckyensis]|uniref:hypothetical protein n=1 Tax=Amycolatopsis kentuckyensis TaxID=218823 RepID=UPI00356AC045
MSIIVTRVYWESFDHLLADDDLINVSIEADTVAPDAVEFRLVAGEGITWWKGLYVPDGEPHGSGWEIWTEGTRTSDSVALWAHQVNNGQDIELRKAKFLTQYRYALGGLDRLAPGSRVTFQWTQDSEADHACWVVRAHVDLPYRDGLFRATANETFQANVTYWNITDSTTWTSDARYRLGSWLPADNMTWGLSRVALPHSVPGFGDGVEFTFTARAPANPGQYPFCWRMVQDGVEWFGERWQLRDGVIAVEPPPPPTSGELTVNLVRQDPSDPAALDYDATATDPSVTPTYPDPRHVLIESVTNTTGHSLYLAHQDRIQQQTSYVLFPPRAQATTPFAMLEVEGRWRARYRGTEPPPPTLTVIVAWRAP